MGRNHTEARGVNGAERPRIIGLSGTFASGKDTLAKRLASDFGYDHVSTGDMVRRVAIEERGSVERPVLQEVAHRHRVQDGAGYFAEKALERPGDVVVSGIRSLGEVRAIRKAGGILVFVDAPIEVRYARMRQRGRDHEVELTLEAFAANEQKEWHAGNSDADFNLRDIKVGADVVIENANNPDEFVAKVYKKLGFTP